MLSWIGAMDWGGARNRILGLDPSEAVLPSHVPSPLMLCRSNELTSSQWTTYLWTGLITIAEMYHFQGPGWRPLAFKGPPYSCSCGKQCVYCCPIPCSLPSHMGLHSAVPWKVVRINKRLTPASCSLRQASYLCSGHMLIIF